MIFNYIILLTNKNMNRIGLRTKNIILKNAEANFKNIQINNMTK